MRQLDGVKRRKTDEQVNVLMNEFADKLLLAIDEKNQQDPNWMKKLEDNGISSIPSPDFATYGGVKNSNL